MLAICTWLWGNKYDYDDVVRLKMGLDRHVSQRFRFLLMTERERVIVDPRADVERHAIKDPELLGYKGCFVRLRMFDRGWQHNRKIDDRLVCMDLDVVVTGSLDALFDRDEEFVILAGGNSMNPCPFNGSVMMLKAGCHHELWDDFSVEAASKIPFYEFPDDQGWFAHKVPRAATWKCGKESGIYAFKKPGWPPGDDLPRDARIVVFPGKRQPKDFRSLKWVRDNW